jgi:hypothetical protein
LQGSLYWGVVDVAGSSSFFIFLKKDFHTSSQLPASSYFSFLFFAFAGKTLSLFSSFCVKGDCSDVSRAKRGSKFFGPPFLLVYFLLHFLLPPLDFLTFQLPSKKFSSPPANFQLPSLDFRWSSLIPPTSLGDLALFLFSCFVFFRFPYLRPKSFWLLLPFLVFASFASSFLLLV